MSLATKASRRAQHHATVLVDWEERVELYQFYKIEDSVTATVSRHMQKCDNGISIAYSCDVIDSHIKRLEEAVQKVNNFTFYKNNVDTGVQRYTQYVRQFVREALKLASTVSLTSDATTVDGDFHCPSLEALVKRLRRVKTIDIDAPRSPTSQERR